MGGDRALSAAALTGLVALEARAPAPIIDLSLLRNRTFQVCLASLVLSFLALFGVASLTPFYLEQLRHLSTEQSG